MDRQYYDGDEGVEHIDAVEEELPHVVNRQTILLVNKNTAFQISEEGIHHCPPDVSEELVVSQGIENFNMDADDSAITPDYIEYQTDMDRSFGSLDVNSGSSNSPGINLWGTTNQWIDDLRENSISPVWQSSENTMLARFADQTEQMEEAEYEAEENFEWIDWN